mgnify:CR=1 FL=1
MTGKVVMVILRAYPERYPAIVPLAKNLHVAFDGAFDAAGLVRVNAIEPEVALLDLRADTSEPLFSRRGQLKARDADAAAEWTRKHMVDFQRGFAMAGLSMRTPIAHALAYPERIDAGVLSQLSTLR